MASFVLPQAGASPWAIGARALPVVLPNQCCLPRPKMRISSSFIGTSASLKQSSRGLRQSTVALADSVATTPETEEGKVEVLDEPSVEVLRADADSPPEVRRKKRRTKGLKNIMEVLHKRAIKASSDGKTLPDLRTGDIVQLKMEVTENKKRLQLFRGIVMSKHSAGIQTTFRIRRVIAGVGVEMVFPLYSPLIKELKVISKRKVRRAKLYYLRYKLARLSTFN